MKAKNVLTALFIIIAISVMLFFMSGRLAVNNSSLASEETQGLQDAFEDDGETGDFPPFPSEIELSPPISSESDDSGTGPVVVPTSIEGGLTMRNQTKYQPDLASLMEEQLSQKLPKEGIQVLIIHTHGSEAYTSDNINEYQPTDTYRTDDKNYSVIRVGDELTSSLESYGISVLHDREIYDYPSYTGSYIRSADAVAQHQKDHPEIAVVLDIHRDAIGTGDVVYKTVAESSGEPSAQLMLVVGTDESGLNHPNWKENLKFALHLQSAVVDKYPSLMRPITLTEYRYNQNMSSGSLIVEVGSSGNTLTEALKAIRLFADAIAPSLLELE